MIIKNNDRTFLLPEWAHNLQEKAALSELENYPNVGAHCTTCIHHTSAACPKCFSKQLLIRFRKLLCVFDTLIPKLVRNAAQYTQIGFVFRILFDIFPNWNWYAKFVYHFLFCWTTNRVYYLINPNGDWIFHSSNYKLPKIRNRTMTNDKSSCMFKTVEYCDVLHATYDVICNLWYNAIFHCRAHSRRISRSWRMQVCETNK